MTEMNSDDPWFIARDGAQHGPLNDNEMKLFVERGHLRATDLVWRQGFADWRPAFSVFPPKPVTPQSRPISSAGPNPSETASTQRPAGPAASYQSGGAPHHSTAAHGTSPALGATSPATIDPHDTEFDDDSAPPRWGRAVASLLVMGALAGAGLWVYVNGTPAFFTMAGTGTETVPVVKAPPGADAAPKPVAAIKPAPAPAPTETGSVRSEVDTKLQKAELWQFLKSQYPNWYASVMKNVEQLDSKDDFDKKLSEVLVSRLIELRRRNAEQVLASSSESLTSVATTFLDNLKFLANRGPEPCYTFISKGEASPSVVELMKDPGKTAPIHGQLLATFKASVEGAKTPVKREAPQKSDYLALTSQLAKIGWNKEDIQLFSNPKALSEAPPARVCQMVQDWFTAHLNLQDTATQERLLYETLRPVVSG